MVVFKIYLSGNNEPSPHIELTGDAFTHYPKEEEVLLGPFTTFQVVEVTEQKRKSTQNIKTDKGPENIAAKVTTVTLVEVPYQHFLKKRQVLPHTIVWYDHALMSDKAAREMIEAKFGQSSTYKVC